MARNQNINVKVATKKVIEALEKSLIERKKQNAEYEKLEKAYQTAKENATKKVATLVKQGKVAITDITESGNYHRKRTSDDEVTFSIDIKVSKKVLGIPENPTNPFSYHSYKEDNQAIENAIRILKMTDEEYVSTSTYSAVSKFI
jgi:N-methylhydantoinase B/oxoprolinase/acetone carboxylase alpha subunit